MGHVPAGPFPEEGAGADVPRREHRGAGASGPRAARAKRLVGRRGERLAEAFLRRRGLTLLGRNLRVRRGEIDLLMRDRGQPVAVEVKSRVAAEPLEAFTPEKRDAVARAARLLRPSVERIDLVTVRFGRSGALIRWLRGV